MVIDFAADLRAIYREAGVRVVYGDQRTDGFLNVVDEAVFGEARVVGTVTELQIIAGSLKDVRQGEEIEAGRTKYRIVQPPRRIGDGSEMVLTLGEL